MRTPGELEADLALRGNEMSLDDYMEFIGEVNNTNATLFQRCKEVDAVKTSFEYHPCLIASQSKIVVHEEAHLTPATEIIKEILNQDEMALQLEESVFGLKKRGKRCNCRRGCDLRYFSLDDLAQATTNVQRTCEDWCTSIIAEETDHSTLRNMLKKLNGSVCNLLTVGFTLWMIMGKLKDEKSKLKEVEADYREIDRQIHQIQGKYNTVPHTVASGMRVCMGGWNGDTHRHGSEGRGLVLTPNGDQYDGDWDSHGMSGGGVMRYSNGNRYEGNWENGKRHGVGTLVCSNGDRYEGEWTRGDSGTGVITYSRKGATEGAVEAVYEGAWIAGKKDGPGMMTFAETGDIYRGTWDKGQTKGRGSFTNAQGVNYNYRSEVESWVTKYWEGREGGW
jgi:hypothetical protein